MATTSEEILVPAPVTTSELTAEHVAQQFGLNGKHGAYAWRVILNSPLDADRCRHLIKGIARPDHFAHQRKPEDAATPFAPADATTLVEQDAPSRVTQEVFAQYGAALMTACASQVQESSYIAFSAAAWPLFSLLKESSFLDAFRETIASDFNSARKLYNAFMRGVVRLVRDGDWVDMIGGEELDEDIKYSFFAAQVHVDRQVVDILILVLPILLNTFKALTEAGGMPPQHPKAAAQTRAQLQKSIDKLAALSLGERGKELIWDENDEATELGDRVAFAYNGLLNVLDTVPQ
ncbi:hypothetical protein BKA62DRAFT_264988 [Auriculariales sp. MPI-PUGE-AT-0066]|nr:hypothetical protein BKA62DRAFT_264988 [Auriculariales sp. MPI-PUGE-AT-0066]